MKSSGLGMSSLRAAEMFLLEKHGSPLNHLLWGATCSVFGPGNLLHVLAE